ncbi:MAG: NAD(P)/FAD-dependent oxidoreductase [Gemmatimonadaceae bacterium]
MARSLSAPVLIVGGGPAGLATAAALSMRGIAYRVVERGPILGHMWRNAYDSLTLHTGRHMSGLPGMGFAAGTPLFPTKDQFWSYLTAYAERYAITVETDCEVRSIMPGSNGWMAETATSIVHTPHVVIATGIMSNPQTPDIPGRTRFTGRVMHSVEYRRPSDFVGQRVLVIGVGNSGGEIASELGHAGVDVTIAVRSGANVVPRQIAGVPIQYIAYGLRTLPLGAREWIADVVQNVSAMKRGAPVFPRARTSALESVPLIGFHLVDAIRAGIVQLKLTGVAEFTAGGIRFADNSERPYDVVILATGFASALGPLGDLVRRDAKGFALRSDRVTSADQSSLYFVGSNYDATGGLANIRTDAMLVAERIARTN